MSSSEVPMLVKTQSPVQDQTSFLYRWDTLVRKNFFKYEADISFLQQGINSLYSNPLTKFRDPIQFGHRYYELESLVLRQQLGHINSAEVKEINQVFSSPYSVSKHMSGSGELKATNTPLVFGAFAACSAFAAYAKFTKGLNVLWLAGAYIPFLSVCLYDSNKQPRQHLNNCYSYLLTKRAATVEMHEG
jgi:hypothetical protein